MTLTHGDGPYWEGFDAVKSGTPCPYTPSSDDSTRWRSGFAYASRVCHHCGSRPAENLLRSFHGKFICAPRGKTVQEVFGITADQCICGRCYNLRAGPQEHVAYEAKHVPQILGQVHAADAESPFRSIAYYALPFHQTWRKGYSAFIVVTNGDRYDIRNPHVSESADAMISMGREEFMRVIESLIPAS